MQHLDVDKIILIPGLPNILQNFLHNFKNKNL